MRAQELGEKLEANREVSGRGCAQARTEREEKSIGTVGENILVGACGSLSAGSAGDSLSLCAGILFASASLSSGDKMGAAASADVMDYVTRRGTPGQLVGGMVLVQVAEVISRWKVRGLLLGIANSRTAPLKITRDAAPSHKSAGHPSFTIQGAAETLLKRDAHHWAGMRKDLFSCDRSIGITPLFPVAERGRAIAPLGD